MTPRDAAIRATVDYFLSSGRNVQILSSVLISGVILPAQFQQQEQILLEIGLNLNLPIPDLLTDEMGFSGTFSFDRQPHRVFIPWAAVGSACVVGDGSCTAFFGIPETDSCATLRPAPRQSVRVRKAGHLRLV